ncbi:MAG: hypothetical protein C0392_09235 [Syntrophus sp. (in: bacteria)]|nr:hypothetical protein [Syntrophus sp. (in: bacteria)]
MLNSIIYLIMLGKDAILYFFEKKGIKTVFHLPGIHTLPLNECFTRSTINVINGRHESNLSYMAIGYGRTTGSPGVLIVTPGPGLGNIVSGCMEAYGDDVPLLIIHIDTGREDIGKGILHELEGPEVIFTHFTKKRFIASHKNELVPVLEKGYHAAAGDRKGPVLVSIPYRFLEKDVSFKMEAQKEKGAEPDLRGLEEALQGKKRPVIIGGKSLMREDLKPLLEDLCNKSSIPFFSTTSGKGTVPEDAEYAFGNIMQKGVAKEIITSSDMVIAIGTRLRDVDAKRRGLKIKDFIHIDIDNAWMGKNYPAALNISGDIKTAVEALCGTLKNRRFDWDLKALKKAQEKERQSLAKTSPGFRAAKLIREAIPDNTITVWDLNLIAYWAEYYFPVIHQNTFIMPRGISPIFYALPAGIGAKLGKPNLPCLAVCGDGGALPALAELATIRQYNIPLVILVCNNNSFGILEDYMSASYGIKGSMALFNPDFVRLAKTFDIKAKRARTLGQLRKIFLKDITWDEPFLIEFDSPVFSPPWR